ncbi:MAG: hypothetical protein ACJ76I_11785 [Gaiellaceae bacterium]
MSGQIVIVAGNRRTFTVAFTVPDVAGAPIDPTTVKFYRLLKYAPGPPETFVYGADSEVERDELGVYTATLDFDTPGTYVVGAEGTGANCHAYSPEVVIVVKPAVAKGE